MNKVILLDKSQAQEFSAAKSLFPQEMKVFEDYETKEGPLVCGTREIQPSKEGALVAVESDILPGHFYSLDTYQEDYHIDLEHFLRTLFSKMGKTDFYCKMSRNQEEFKALEEKIHMEGDAGAIVLEASAQAQLQNTQRTEKKQSSTLKHKSGDLGGKCTPEELQAWLDENEISDRALEKLGVADIVETFKREGGIKAGAFVSRFYEMEKIFQEASDEQADFQARIGMKKGLQNFFAKGFLAKLSRLNLGVEVGGSGARKTQTESYEKYALFYEVKF
ncbi:hypothetical protein [Helicobacter felis]|uniref:hypothetical protein n=1 Tax=Helicobacter felis TaxID=214 RepID=UPI000CEF4129|nr:hypothetical protein [Helicobacter felis]